MSDEPRRRWLDRTGGAPSLLALGSRMVGDIETPGALMVSGWVRGDGSVGGDLSITAQARWEGDVHARSAVVAGQITGSIVVAEKLEIAASAVIRGRVSARQIAMARGATIDGDVTVTSNEPIVEFVEKRASDPGDPHEA